MNAPDPSTIRAARHLWSRLAGSSGDMPHVLAAADAVLTELDGGLRRWVGAEGYAVLLKRAVVLTLPDHPALSLIADLQTPATPTNGVVYRSADVALGMISLLATLMDLLGRIIGVEMAARLVEHVGGPSSRGIASKSNPEVHDD